MDNDRSSLQTLKYKGADRRSGNHLSIQLEGIDHQQSGFFADKDVRHLLLVESSSGPLIWGINNNERHDIYALMANAES